VVFDFDVVVSAARDDASWALAIAGVLDALGLRVVHARDEAGAAQRSAVLVAVMSPSYLRSRAELGEWARAVAARQRIVVAQVRRSPLPPLPGGRLGLFDHRIDLLDADAHHLGSTDLPGLVAEAVRLAGYTPAPDPASRSSAFRILYSEADAGVAAEISSLLAATRNGTISRERVEGPPTLLPGEVLVVLLSQGMLATQFGRSHLPRLLVDDASTVVPVLVGQVPDGALPYGRFGVLPAGGVPIVDWESRGAAIASVVDGILLELDDLAAGPGPVGRDTGDEPIRGEPWPDGSGDAPAAPRYRLAQVFTRSGLPTVTFVEPPDFHRLVMALRTPGRGIVLEGPSGIGKTTLLRQALARLGDEVAPIQLLSARRPADLTLIENLANGHDGLAAVDDIHRLPESTRQGLLDYLKLLADTESPSRLVVVGIPGTGASLIRLGFDVATRVDVFRLPRVDDRLVREAIRKGEEALNITFAGASRIVRASAGSLLTAQTLCWELAVLAGVEVTQPFPTPVKADIGLASAQVARACALKYDDELRAFASLGRLDDMTGIHLLIELGRSDDGILHLDHLSTRRPDLAPGIALFLASRDEGLRAVMGIANHLHYDPVARLLICEDPQLLFYLRQLDPERIAMMAGRRLPRSRDQVFVSYSHRDRMWLDRLDVHLRPLVRDNELDLWADTRLAAGDLWLEEISSALDRARVAILLISADFLASDFIMRREVPPLLAAAARGGCRIIPLIVGPSLFADEPTLSAFQAVNPPGQPLAALPAHEADAYLVKVARALRVEHPAPKEKTS